MTSAAVSNRQPHRILHKFVGNPVADTGRSRRVGLLLLAGEGINPLIVQGTFAGPQATATGVFADMVRVAAGQGAKP